VRRSTGVSVEPTFEETLNRALTIFGMRSREWSAETAVESLVRPFTTNVGAPWRQKQAETAGKSAASTQTFILKANQEFRPIFVIRRNAELETRLIIQYFIDLSPEIRENPKGLKAVPAACLAQRSGRSGFALLPV